MLETFNSILGALLPHVPFIACSAIFSVVMQFMKVVFPKNGWLTKKPAALYYWGRKSLPLQPVVAGAIIGIFARHPEPFVTSLLGSMAYFAMAGLVSIWLYDTSKTLLKKQGIDLDLPGIDSTTPPPSK